MTKLPRELLSAISQFGIGNIREVRPVLGGDINQAFCLTGTQKYFLKINDAVRYPSMFEKEAEGLKAMKGLTHCVVPEVVGTGAIDNNQFLLLKWIEPGNPQKNFWEIFGIAMAELHRRTIPVFGYDEDNYIGSLPQRNTSAKTWGEFYCQNRIMPLLKQLNVDGLVDSKTMQSALKLCEKLNDIFPAEPPSLLHGDLWSGNFMVASDGNPCIYDPAVYYGHREMDLGMTKLFGGFDKRFYQAYHEAHPLERDWEKRVDFTQLYPLLVHAILFGGHYVGRVAAIINKFG